VAVADAGSAAIATTAKPDAAVAVDAHAPADAALVVAVADARAPADAASAVGSGSNAVAVTPSKLTPAAPSAPGDALSITSDPPGARLFIDGADQGVTPVKLAGSADHHTAVLLLAGHDLYIADVDGHGTFSVPLKEVTPSNGPAGIKVLKCAPNRYYVSVDGKPTGQLCPTERIGCELGAHTVEIYDAVTATHRKWDIQVVDTRLSFRVRVDP
jgi:hypothetical protein